MNRQPKCYFFDKVPKFEKINLSSFKKGSIQFINFVHVVLFVLEVSKLLLCQWYYNKTQPSFREHNLGLLYMDTVSFIFFIKPSKELIQGSKHFLEIFDLYDLEPSHELIAGDKRNIGRMKMQTAPGSNLIVTFVLWSQPYSNKMKPNESQKKEQKRAQDQNCYTLEISKKCLGKKSKYGVKKSFRNNKYEISMVEQKKLLQLHLMIKDVILMNIIVHHGDIIILVK